MPEGRRRREERAITARVTGDEITLKAKREKKALNLEDFLCT